MATPSLASRIEVTAMARASHSTRLVSLPRMPSSSRCLISSGLTTTRAASMTTKSRKLAISDAVGQREPTIRRTVSRDSFCSTTDRSGAREPSMAQGLMPLMGPPSRLRSECVSRLRQDRGTGVPAPPLGQPLRLEVARPPPAAAAPWSPVRRPRCWRGRPRPGLTWSRPARSRGTTTVAMPSSRASSASTNLAVAQISSAREGPTSSTRGFVPARSGTSPSAGSFMQNCTSSATTRRSQARASWKPAPMA